MTEKTTSLYNQPTDQLVVGGEGIYLIDADGKRYLDCSSGTYNMSLGYQHPAVVAAIKQQADILIDAPARFQTSPVNELAARLTELAPGQINMAHLNVSGGSTANEGAIKMAQAATGRRDVITTFRSHIGQTMATISFSGNSFRKAPFAALMPGSLQVPDPYCFRCFYGQDRATCNLMCIDRIDDFLEFASSGSVAAIVIEAVYGYGGNIVPPAGYFKKLRAFCDERDIRLVVDEIQAGVGRTGYMFASEFHGIVPDAITLGKGLGGSGVQMAGILAGDSMRGLSATDHSFTFGTNTLAAAAALATVEIVSRPEFLANVRSCGAIIQTRLRDMQNRVPAIGDVRGVGLMIGVELVNPDGSPAVSLTESVISHAPDHGLQMRSARSGLSSTVKVRPPLIITPEESHLLCDRVESLLAAECR